MQQDKDIKENDGITNDTENAAETAVNETENDEKKHDKKSAETRKIEKLEKALAKAEEERDAMRDGYQRTFSDFNNYKKRNQASVAQAMAAGAAETIEKILPVIDNFERALEHISDEQDSPLAEGMMMVYKQLSDILAGMGVTEIPALNETFDPTLHQAIQQVDAKEGELPNTVVMVAQKGYRIGDKILRHSMVIVNK